MSRVLGALLSLPFALWCHFAWATDPGDRTFTPLGGGQIGGSASVGAKGNLALALPLKLPSPRGGVPLPFTISYNGSNVVGAAGMGWDIPIPGVTWQHNLSRRKPIHRFDGQPDPATADRVMVDMGNGPMVMAPTDTAGVYQPFGNGYYELRFTGFAFTGRDASGRVWTFETIPALFDNDFYALTTIADSTGKNRVDFHYDVYDKFSPDPVQFPPDLSQLSMRELVLREITHSPVVYDEALKLSCPKYRIQLDYVTWPGLNYPVPYPHLLSLDFQAGRPRAHTRLLHSVKVQSNINTSCLSFILPTDRTYVMNYTADDLTGQPRLTKVDMFGAEDSGSDPSTALPVTAYEYGSPLVSAGLQYAAAEQVSIPAGPAGTNDGLSASFGTGPGAPYGLVRGFQDFDGDGRADFFTLDSTAQKPVLAINKPSDAGNDFSTLFTRVDLPNDPAAPYNLGAPDLAVGLPVAESIDNTYQQVIDFNGDGRPDIIVTTEGRNPSGERDPNYWMILINTPGPSGDPSDIIWLERQVDVTAVRAAIQSSHMLSLWASTDQNSKPLPTARTMQVGAFAHNTIVESGILTQWKLIDVNGDGFPDIVFDSEDVTAFDSSSCDAAGNCQNVLRQDHPPTTKLMVIYHTGPMMAGSGAETQNVWNGPAVTLRTDGACGVERLVWGHGSRQLKCGFMEVNGDGIPDYVINDAGGIRAIRSPGLAEAHDVRLPENRGPDYGQQEAKRAIVLPGPVGVTKDPLTAVCGGNTNSDESYLIEQQTALRDITGDGIADYIYFGARGALADGTPISHPSLTPADRAGPQGWWFMPGTGAGFAAPLPIRTPPDLPFAIHVSRERCDGRISTVLATLQDVDGDGRPELVRALGSAVHMAKLVNAAGELGAHSAGQLTAIDNRYGSVTRFTYGSAKSSWLTHGGVPFPEIVVTQTEQTAEVGRSNGMAPVHYAYGRPEFIYHPVLGRWVFGGYRRRVTMIGETTSTAGILTGTAQIVDSLGGSDNFDDLNRLMLTGRPRDVTTVAGLMHADPRRLLLDKVDSFQGLPNANQHTEWKTQALPGTLPGLVPFEEECYAPPSVQSPGVWSDLVLCRRSATAYVAEQTSWEGASPYPAPNSVARRSVVTAVDDYARPTRITLEGDRARTDDDVCAQIDYASPAPGAALVLNAPHTVYTRECAGNASRTLAGVRYSYDNLPEGQVGRGLPSGEVLERWDPQTGTSLGEIQLFAVQQDIFGNPVTIARTREDGAAQTTTVTYDPFGLAPVSVQTDATNGDGTALPSLKTTITRDNATLLALSTTGPNGTQVGHTYDRFNRVLLSTITPAGGTTGALSSISYLGFGVGESGGRRVVQKVFADPVALADVGSAVGRTGTTVLDELGRVTRTEAALGSDYANQTLIFGQRVYDGLGRVKFEADPHPSTESISTAYGTSRFFNADGTPSCFVRGNGLQAFTNVTDEAHERYPTCFRRFFGANREFVDTQGADSLLAGSPQAGVVYESVYSAIGQLLEHATYRLDANASLIYLEDALFGHDKLGHLISMTRYQDRQSPIGETVATAWHVDSIGQVLELDEPDSAPQFRSYSNWGELTQVQWCDTITSPCTDRRVITKYDALGRLLHREEHANNLVDAETVNDFTYDRPATFVARVTPTNVRGRLASASSPTSRVSFSYDGLGRVNARGFDDREGSTYIEKRTYHGDGSLSELHLLLPDTGFNDERIGYSYDSAGRLRTANYSDGTGGLPLPLFNLDTIDRFGRIRQASIGLPTFNGPASYSASYADTGRRLLQDAKITSAAGSASREISLAAIPGFVTAFDPIGREQVRQETENGTATPAKLSVYDALGRLKSDSNNGLPGKARQFSYDPLGNLLTLTESTSPGALGSVTLSYQSTDRDRICSIGYGSAALSAACDVKYDGLGNITEQKSRSNGVRKFEYFANGQVKKIADGNGNAADFRYDAFGAVQQLELTGNTPDTRHDHHFGGLISVRDETSDGTTMGPVITRTIPGPLISATRHGASGPWIFALGESRGNRFFIEAGDFVQDVSYAPYGEATSTGQQPHFAGYSSQQWNSGDTLAAFGLSQLGARIYDPVIGRFLSRDPILIPRTAATTNPYAFAMNDPVNSADPTGLDSDAECLVCQPSGLQWSPGSLPGLGGPPSHANPQAGEPSSPSASVQLANGCIATCPTCCHGPNDGRPGEVGLFGPLYPYHPGYDDVYIEDNSPGILESIHDYFVESTTDALTSVWTNITAGVYDTYGAPRPGTANISADVRPGIRTGVNVGVTVTEQLALLGFTAGGGAVADESAVLRFAHGTSPAFVESVTTGLDAEATAAASAGGTALPRGSFFAHEIGPPGAPGPGLQLAYEWGLRHSPTPAVMIGQIPRSVATSLIKSGALRILRLEGAPIPQLVFDPSSFRRVNASVQWLQTIWF